MKHVLIHTLFCFSSLSALAGSLTISGISSGGFMASQMATIYSDQYNGVATVAGGVFFCAKNEFRKNMNTYGSAGLFHFGVDPNTVLKTMGYNPINSSNNQLMVPLPSNPIYQSVGVCMGRPEGAHQPETLYDGKPRPMNLDFMKVFVDRKLIAPPENIAKQRVLIYQGKHDEVVKPGMANKLIEFYNRMGVSGPALRIIAGEGNHNFPTLRKDGLDCNTARFPYIANCNQDLAGDILQHMVGRKLNRGKFNVLNFRRIQQKDAPPSLAQYGYIYASPFCLQNPSACDLHVALHGCQMSDDYDETFNKLYQSKVQMTHVVTVTDLELTARHPQMGGLSFARRSGFAEYAEDPSNHLMILFPQTQITKANFPDNPNGCWDWFGWTGSYYATNKGAEASWLNNFVNQVRTNPRALFMKPITPQEAGN